MGRMQGKVAVVTGDALEPEILNLLARGMTAAATAAQLFISPVTVRNSVAAILSRLNAHSRRAAVAFAFRPRLV